MSLLLYLGGLGPMIADIILVHLTYNRIERRDYWRRVIDFRRISGKWYAVILLFFPLLSTAGLLLHILSGGHLPEFELANRFIEQPMSIFQFAIFILLFGPLPEELGWRGYALDRLQEKRSALEASLILGSAWALWHLPLFFMKTTYQYQMGLGSLSFYLYSVNMILDSVLYTWIYNNTGRSILSAILFHFMTNFTGELFPLPQQAELYKLALRVIIVAGVIVYWGAGTLKRQKTYGNQEGYENLARLLKDTRS